MEISKKISVIIPCYNQARFLNDALNSILNQTYQNWECIIVNDGSPDNTEKVALSWTEKDQRFMYLKKVNGGLSSARNAGLDIATGDYIQFLDSDDAIDRIKFQLQVEQMEGDIGYVLSYCDYFSSIESDLNIPHQNRYLSPKFKSDKYFEELILDWEFRLSIPCHCFLFDARIFKNNNIVFDENLPNHEDWECWMNVFAIYPIVFYIDKKLATYRIRDNAMCTDSNLMKKGYIEAIKKQLKKHDDDIYIRRLLIKKLKEVDPSLIKIFKNDVIKAINTIRYLLFYYHK